MNQQTAKEFLNIQRWIRQALEITSAGRDAYDKSAMLREAGDSLSRSRPHQCRSLVSSPAGTPGSGQGPADEPDRVCARVDGGAHQRRHPGVRQASATSLTSTPTGVRTPDPRIKSPLLCQLSYGGN